VPTFVQGSERAMVSRGGKCNQKFRMRLRPDLWRKQVKCKTKYPSSVIDAEN
jgi:hypothetical protein